MMMTNPRSFNYFLTVCVEKELGLELGSTLEMPTKKRNLKNLLSGKGKVQRTSSVYDQWALQQKQNSLLYTFFILTYLFFNDDGVISKMETKLLKKLLKRARGVFTKEHYLLIIDMTKVRMEESSLLSYVTDHKIPQDVSKKVLLDVFLFLGARPAYTKLLQDLKSDIDNLY